MGRILSVGTIILFLANVLLKGAISTALTTGIIWLVGLFFPTVASTWGLPGDRPYEAVVAAASTLTSKPPTPTVEPAERAWERGLPQLDSLWEQDWAATINVLRDFLKIYPNHGEARQKLYAALVTSGRELQRSGHAEEGIKRLTEADGMFPGREAHLALLALRPTPPPATATPVPPTSTPSPPPPTRLPPPTATPAPPPSSVQQAAPPPAPAAPVRRGPELMGQVHFPSLCNQLYPGFEAWNPGDSPNGWRCLLLGSGGQRTVQPISSEQIAAWCRKEYGDDVSSRLQDPNNVYGWQCWSR